MLKFKVFLLELFPKNHEKCNFRVMCYDVSYLTRKLELYEKRFNRTFKNPDAIQLKIPVYHGLGYDHPDLPVITTHDPGHIDFYQWGFIPHWVNDPRKAVTIQNQTLNARGEELFEKPSFRDAIQWGNRCLVLLDGFYEHHHKQQKIFPHYITFEDEQPFAVAGLWSKWQAIDGMERFTCTIITSPGNELLSTIHNNPKLRGPRMPLILSRENEERWLGALDKKEVISLVKPFLDIKMKAHPVRRLRGKETVGNLDLAQEPYQYPELSARQGSLF